MTEHDALRITNAQTRFGYYRKEDGALSGPYKLYRIPGSDKWLSWDTFKVEALRELMRQKHSTQDK